MGERSLKEEKLYRRGASAACKEEGKGEEFSSSLEEKNSFIFLMKESLFEETLHLFQTDERGGLYPVKNHNNSQKSTLAREKENRSASSLRKGNLAKREVSRGRRGKGKREKRKPVRESLTIQMKE